MLTLHRVIAATVLVVPTWLIACASADPGPASGKSDFTGGSSGTSGAAQKTATSASPPAAPKPATPQASTATCAAKTTENDCYDCCYGNSKPTAAADKVANDCTTNAAQKCGSACVAEFAGNSGTDLGEGSPASASASSADGAEIDPKAPDPCAACETDISACDAVYQKACAADPACAAADKCYADAKCTDKGGDDAVGTTGDPATGTSGGGTSSGGM